MTKTFELDDKGEIANTTQMSPTKPKPQPVAKNPQVDFYTALQAVSDGVSTATKAEWNNPAMLMKLIGETLCINVDNGKLDTLWHPFTIRLPDMAGKDWIIL